VTAPGVVVVGSVNRDYTVAVDHLPGPGETVLGGALSIGSGGKGANQAAAAALLGVPCALIAAVGSDADGRALVADLMAAGVDTGEVSVVPGVRTGSAFVLLGPDGDNSIVVAPGANGTLSPGLVTTAVQRLLGRGGVLVTQAEIPPEAAQAAVMTAAGLGARVVLNLAPFRPVAAGVLALADPLVVNEGEAGALLGRPVGADLDARSAAAALVGRARSVVLTVGGEGAWLATESGATHVPVVPVEVVDSTGAGDALTGVLAAALSLGHDLATALRWGVAAGTYAVGRAGAQASYPRAGDLWATTGPIRVGLLAKIVDQRLEHPGRLL